MFTYEQFKQMNSQKIGSEWMSTYHLVGDIQNGSFVTHEEVTRKVTRMDDKFVYCECGRRFFINKNLHVYIPNRRRL